MRTHIGRRIVVAVCAAAGLALAAAFAAGPGPAADAWGALRVNGADEVEHYEDALQMRDAADLVVVGTFADFAPGRTQTVPNGLGEGVDDTLFWIDGRFRVEEVITTARHVSPANVVDNGWLTVEFFVGGAEEAEYIADDVARLRSALGEQIGRAVLFLRQDGSPLEPGAADPCVDWPADELEAFGMTPQACDREKILAALDEGGGAPATASAGLRLVWSYGLIAATDERPVDAPLGEVPDEHHGDQKRPLVEPEVPWANLDEFIAHLRG